MKIHIVFHSMYGHVWKLAEAIAEGARGVEGAEVKIFRVPETMSEEALAQAGATEAQQAFAHLPVATNDDLVAADALIFGAGTRYGSMAGQMRTFLDQTGGLWAKGALEGKVGAAFASTATQHGGQELTLMAFHANMFHFGMVLVGLPYSAKEQMTISEITGGAPYGVTTIAGGQGERQPSENELTLARFQGKHVAELAKKLAK